MSGLGVEGWCRVKPVQVGTGQVVVAAAGVFGTVFWDEFRSFENKFSLPGVQRRRGVGGCLQWRRGGGASGRPAGMRRVWVAKPYTPSEQRTNNNGTTTNPLDPLCLSVSLRYAPPSCCLPRFLVSALWRGGGGRLRSTRCCQTPFFLLCTIQSKHCNEINRRRAAAQKLY